MQLDVLPTRSAGAAENMATDFLLLQRYPRAEAPRFRHYGWHRPAFTFGYAQKFSFVRTQWPADGHFDICRRATGGRQHRNRPPPPNHRTKPPCTPLPPSTPPPSCSYYTTNTPPHP